MLFPNLKGVASTNTSVFPNELPGRPFLAYASNVSKRALARLMLGGSSQMKFPHHRPLRFGGRAGLCVTDTILFQ